VLHSVFIGGKGEGHVMTSGQAQMGGGGIALTHLQPDAKGRLVVSTTLWPL